MKWYNNLYDNLTLKPPICSSVGQTQAIATGEVIPPASQFTTLLRHSRLTHRADNYKLGEFRWELTKIHNHNKSY